jgi:hypothetical protein
MNGPGGMLSAGSTSKVLSTYQDCTIRISGSGNCEVNVVNNLFVQVSGVGDIFYKGSPTLTSDISGVGNITAVGD